MKQLLALLTKLPNVHDVHEKVTAIYNFWLALYTGLLKLGFATGSKLTPEQAQAVLNAEFAAAQPRSAPAAPVAPAPAPAAQPAPAFVDGPPAEPTDTDFMRASGLLE